MTTDTDEFLKATIDFWEERGGKRYSRHDARVMARNVAGFFRTLDRWERERRQTKREDSRPALRQAAGKMR